MLRSVEHYSKQIKTSTRQDWVMSDLVQDYIQDHTTGCCPAAPDTVGKDLQTIMKRCSSLHGDAATIDQSFHYRVLSYYVHTQNPSAKDHPDNPSKTRVLPNSNFARLIFAFCAHYPSLRRDQNFTSLFHHVICTDTNQQCRSLEAEIAMKTSAAAAARNTYVSQNPLGAKALPSQTSTPFSTAMREAVEGRGHHIERAAASTAAQSHHAHELSRNTTALALKSLSEQLTIPQGRICKTSLASLKAHITTALEPNASRESIKDAAHKAVIVGSFLSEMTLVNFPAFVREKAEQKGIDYTDHPQQACEQVQQLYLEGFIQAVHFLAQHPLIDEAGKTLAHTARTQLELLYPLNEEAKQALDAPIERPDLAASKIINTQKLLTLRKTVSNGVKGVRRHIASAFAGLSHALKEGDGNASDEEDLAPH